MMPSRLKQGSHTGNSSSRIRENLVGRSAGLVRRVGSAAILPLFMAIALLLGGGGSPAPFPELLVEWAALAALVVALWLRQPGETPLPRGALGISAAMLALPAIQLIPLPPALWTALPGRESVVSALALVGEQDRWMPWSVSPPRTLAALLALIPPVAALLLAAYAAPRARTAALITAVAMAVAAALLGAAQLAAGAGTALRPYGSEHSGYLTGFHANRNAAADMLLIGLFALAGLFASGPARRGTRWRLPFAASAPLLIVAVLLTGSRAGIALLGLTGITGAAWLAVSWRRGPRVSQTHAAAWSIGGVLVMGAAAWALSASTVATRIAARFTAGRETRPDLWIDTLFAAGQHWPWGRGLGTFVPVFVAAERLEVVDKGYPNRAHNDYLELALEGGLPGLVLLATLGGWLAWRLVQRLRRAPTPDERIELIFAGATLALLAAHSVVDYPFRSMSLAVLGGLAAGLILSPGITPRNGNAGLPRGDEAG